jgi:hypothetical protein
MRERLRHPFWQAVVIMILAYLFFKFGLGTLPQLIGIKSAPLPASVLFQYMMTVLVGVLLYVSDNETRWSTFKAPMHAVVVDGDKRILRSLLLVLIPLLVGFVAFQQVRPTVDAPSNLRSIHPAPPSNITFSGKTITLTGLNNPLRSRGSLPEHYEEGKRVYVQNCMPCHGDALDGSGHYASALNPTPANFTDNGTIAQLTESFVFWRIAKGGVGLPKEGAPWNSAMPAWEGILSEDEIWAVIIYLYQQTGWSPRTWEEAEGAAHE